MTQRTGPDHRPTSAMHPWVPDGSDPGPRVIDLADLDWCWSRLRGSDQGVLSSRCPQTPLKLDVGYTVVGGQILIPIAWDSEVLHLLAGHEVTLSLAGRGADGQRWVVRVTGVAEFAMVPTSSGTMADGQSSHPATGATSEGSDTMVLPADRLRGYRETPLDDVSDGLAPPSP